MAVLFNAKSGETNRRRAKNNMRIFSQEGFKENYKTWFNAITNK